MVPLRDELSRSSAALHHSGCGQLHSQQYLAFPLDTGVNDANAVRVRSAVLPVGMRVSTR